MHRYKYELALRAMRNWEINIYDGTIRTRQGLASTVGCRGYSLITTRIDGRSYTFKQHQIIVIAAGLCPIGFQINHIDGNKLNNSISNLEVVTGSENIQHAFRLGLRTVTNRKFSDGDVRDIRSMLSTGIKSSKIAERYGVSKQTIYRIRNGTYYKEVV